LRGCQEGHIAVNYCALARKITSSARLLNVRDGTVLYSTHEISPIWYNTEYLYVYPVHTDDDWMMMGHQEADSMSPPNGVQVSDPGWMTGCQL
jgi:hypothetical protein